MNQKRKILLSVTGMSPAVVTETLYALVTEKNFIPTEIQVITTEQGKNLLKITVSNTVFLQFILMKAASTSSQISAVKICRIFVRRKKTNRPPTALCN